MSTLIQPGVAVVLLSAVIATGASASVTPEKKDLSFQAKGTTSAGSGAATVAIEVSEDDTAWDQAGAITLTLGTASTSGSFALSTKWKFVRANLTAISGTGAAVTVTMGQ